MASDRVLGLFKFGQRYFVEFENNADAVTQEQLILRVEPSLDPDLRRAVPAEDRQR
jgi:hypothetical protein